MPHGILYHFIEVGGRGRKLMPYSEGCIHMRIAGKYMDFEILEQAVQLFVTDDNTPRFSQHFSSPILLGEAGVKEHDPPIFYYLPHGLHAHDDPLASEPPRTPTTVPEVQPAISASQGC